MSDTKFTNGPWVARYNNSWFELIGSDGEWIADTCASSCKGNINLGKANAYLIACAPEMYEEIERDIDELIVFLQELDSYSDDYLFYSNKLERKQALLSKARGEHESSS